MQWDLLDSLYFVFICSKCYLLCPLEYAVNSHTINANNRQFYSFFALCPIRPANLLLDRSSSEVTSVGTVGDWMDGMRTLPCKEAFSGVSYSSCDTLAKTSTE